MADLGIFIKTIFQGKGFDEAKKAAKGVGEEGKKGLKTYRDELGRLRDENGRFVAEGKKGAKGLKLSFGGLGNLISGELAGLASGFGLALGAKELADLAIGTFQAAEQAKVATSAFTNLSGSANIARLNLQAMDRATRGLISDTEQMQIANQLLGMNIVQTSDQLEEVVGVSRRLGKEFRGLGAREAAEEFAIMIANMSVARLDSFGISSANVRKGIQELQAATEGLTKEQAFFQATMIEGEKVVSRLGSEINTTADEASRLKREFSEIQVAIGQAAEETGVMQKFIKSLTDDLVIFRGIFLDDTPETQLKKVRLQIEQTEEQLKVLAERERSAGFFGILAAIQIPKVQAILSELQAEFVELNAIQEESNRIAEEEQAALQARIRSEELAAESTAKRVEAEKKLLGIQKQFAVDVLSIQRETADQLSESQDQFDDDSEDTTEDHFDRLEDLRKRFAKSETKAAKKLQKDLVKVDTNLKKRLIKQQANENKAVEKAQKNFAKEDRNTQRRKQINALGDERLFQFELRNLAADGQGIAIKQALERRAIEQEIASEKAEFEKDVEQEKRKDVVDSIRSEGQERRSELQQQATERQDDLRERNQEASEERKQALIEAELQEDESFEERKLALSDALSERNEQIRESEIKRVEEIAKGISQVEGLMEGSLDKMISLAEQFGPQFGQAFADGMAQAFEEEKVVESAIESAAIDFGAGAGALPGGPTTSQTNGQGARLGGASQFQQGGFIQNTGVGLLHQGEVVANPSEGQAIVIDGEEFAVFEAERLGAAINANMQRAFQSYTDVVAQALQ